MFDLRSYLTHAQIRNNEKTVCSPLKLFLFESSDILDFYLQIRNIKVYLQRTFSTYAVMVVSKKQILSDICPIVTMAEQWNQALRDCAQCPRWMLHNVVCEVSLLLLLVLRLCEMAFVWHLCWKHSLLKDQQLKLTSGLFRHPVTLQSRRPKWKCDYLPTAFTSSSAVDHT